MAAKIPFDKPPCNNDQFTEILKNRGLTINDTDKINRYFDFIGYFRLSAYFSPYQHTKDQFNEGVQFEDILKLYVFDRKLKLVLMDAIERIEVAIRSVINNYMSVSNNDPHWFLDESYFDNYSQTKGKSFQNHQGLLDSISSSITKQNDALPVVHYQSKYSEPTYPPGWIVMELLTFGQVSKMYSILKTTHKKKIAKKFKTSWQLLEAVLGTLTVIRNKCAHHQRVWNVKISYPPSDIVMKKIASSYTGDKTAPCVAYFMIWFLLKRMNTKPTWGNKLCEQLLELDTPLFPLIGSTFDNIYIHMMENK
ncbi:MAG: Abi family protein [Proteobacteria bacterium]|nr:Abi family protein [Pseudomonadota bacterium]